MISHEEPDFLRHPDLAARPLGGSVVYANDEFFAERENLINPAPAAFDPAAFGHKGKVYDGWETRRRREPGHDAAMVRLGVPGVVTGVVVDTSWFTGNYPPEISVEAACVDGYPPVEEILAGRWETLVARTSVLGDSANAFAVTDTRCFTHVRLSIHPDGGVARFRVHGRPMPDPRLLRGTVDLAGAVNGGSIVDCSNEHYSSPAQLLLPDRARSMGEGWENARRRGGGHDHVTVRLGARGTVRRVEIDTSYFLGNAPGQARLWAVDGDLPEDAPPGPGWRLLGDLVDLRPDTRHHLHLSSDVPVTHVRLDVLPDGGVARLRVHGEVTDEDWSAYARRWQAALPESRDAKPAPPG